MYVYMYVYNSEKEMEPNVIVCPLLHQYVNSSYLNLTGYSREEAVGKPATDILKTVDQRIENGPSSGLSLKVMY